MSKDIRSFFSVVSKKSGSDSSSTSKPKKNAKIIDSDDDIVEETPPKLKSKKESVHKKRPPVLSSDSEEECKDKPKKKEKISSNKEKLALNISKLKPVNIDSLFSNATVKQSKVEYVPPKESENMKSPNKNKSEKSSKKGKRKNPELGIHNDEAFEKTLIELDEDDDTILLENMDILDKTMEEAEKLLNIENKEKKEHDKEKIEKAEKLMNNDKKEKKDHDKETLEKAEKLMKDKKKEKKDHDKETIEKAEKLMMNEKKEKKDHNKEEQLKKQPWEEHKNTPKREDKKRPRKNSVESKITPSSKKPKLEHVDSGIDNDQERWEKKRFSAALYQKYLNRSGPKHHGQKEIPEGTPDCLKNLTFLRTGVLDSLDSEEFENLIKSHGGRTVHAVSKKVNYVVVGDDPGPAKLEKAKNYKIAEITEDELLDMILVKSGMKAKHSSRVQSEDQGIGSGENSPEQNKKSKDQKIKKEKESPTQERKHPKEISDSNKPSLKKLKEIKTEKDNERSHKSDDILEIDHKKDDNLGKSHKEHRNEEISLKIEEKNSENIETNKIKKEQTSPHKKEETSTKNTGEKSNRINPKPKLSGEELDALKCWTEKYKPTTLKAIIGQQDPNSNMYQLRTWLKNWDHNQKPEVRKHLPRPTPWNQFDGAYYKAALLSGSPGVGKTTTATLVAQDLGYDIVEFNASDTRSKKMLHEEISHMLNQKSVSSFAQGHKNLNKKRVLLMDEVDGMAGNEDRGGVGELINLIKLSNFPIICMCNDRNHQKMRTLVTHCFGLRFNKPALNQVRGAMMSICFKEGLKIKPEALAELINGTGCDIRQTLNNLTMWSALDKNLTDSTVKTESAKAHKDVVFGPWDVARKVFTYSENQNMSIIDKARLFFYDYSLGPLFVQDNYLRSKPKCTSKTLSVEKETILRMCLTAESLSIGDRIDSKIRSTQNWSLLDSQAYFSTVIPSCYMTGEIKKIEFPGWFGKNSSQNKTKRLVSELHAHMRTSASGDKKSIRMDYCIPLRNAIVNPLRNRGVNGVKDALEVMKHYCLLREDLNNLVELCQSFKNKDIFNDVEPKVKAAFTRAYNKEVLLPFAPPAVSKKKRTAEDDQFGDGENDDQNEDDDDQQDDSVENDGMIKVKPAKPPKNSASKASSSKADSKPKTSKASTSKASTSKAGTSKTPSKGKGKK